MSESLIIERVNQGNCPICDKPFGDEEMTFIDYNGTKQPVHKKHDKREPDEHIL